MRIKIWGARGSIPTPVTSLAIRDKIISALEGAVDLDLDDPTAIAAYVESLPLHIQGTMGGNTACIEVEADQQTIILDAGSGIRPLGQALMAGPCGRGEGVLHLFLSHTHWDHIQGLPFFLPAYIPGNRIYIYSVHDVAPTLAGQLAERTFPIPYEEIAATLRYVPLTAGERLTLGKLTVSNLLLPHPGGAYAYRIDHQGLTFVYASDAEYKHLDEPHLEPYLRFYAGADALIFDAQFTLRESLAKIDWGHSSALYGAEIARRAGVKRLILFHHDPMSADHNLSSILEQTLIYQQEYEDIPSCEVILGYEGLEIELTPRHTPRLSLAMAYRIDCLEGNHTAIVRLAGDFDERAVADLEHRLIKVPMSEEKREGEAEAASKHLGLIVDMGGITRLSIVGLRALIDLRRHWEGNVIVLANLAPQVQRVIEVANCLDFFAIYPTLQAAQAALEARRALGLPGQLLKQRYRIEARLGTSETGALYKATDIRLDRPVTIKVLSPSFSQNVIARLLHEAQRMAQLNNFNIVSIYDWEEEAGLAYLVSEYVAGQTLRQVIEHSKKERSGTVPAALEIALDILRALEYAHSKGVVHGNLKPENVLLADELKLRDFGLRWMSEGQALTEVPLPITKADYLAPEQIRGEGTEIRTDLYAFGVILYELFTGQRPFTGLQVVEQHLTEPPVPPRQINPELSRSLEHLILKLLSKEPSRRYGSATQVRRVLQGVKRQPPNREVAVSQERAGRAPAPPLPLLLAHQRQERFIGREAQLQHLLSLWDQSQGRQGRLAFIAGEAGVGKTRLSKEVATYIGEATILAGQCSELEGSPPYQPFIEIGESYLTRTPPPALRQQLGEAASPIALLLPRIRSLLPDLTPPPTLGPEQDRLRLMHAFTQFVARAADARPWFLLLDDLHWADPASLQLLQYLARHLLTMPLFIVVTYRDVELDLNPALGDLIREVSRYPVYHHITLERLDRSGVRELLEGMWSADVPEAWVRAIYERTGGNPFYVEEVAKGLTDEGAATLRDGVWSFTRVEEINLPQSVRDIVLRRLARLSPTTQEILRLAAVLGPQFTFADLLATAEETERALLEALDEALERDLIREVDAGGGFSFTHAEIQQVIYEEMSRLRRRTLHRRVVTVLEKAYSGKKPSIAGYLAYHFIQAGNYGKGFLYSLEAAQQARALYAYESALSWYTQASAYLPEGAEHLSARVILYEGLGEMLCQQAHYAEAVSAYRAMREAAAAAGDPLAQAHALNGLSEVQIKQSDYTAALESAQAAERVAEGGGSVGQFELLNALFQQGWILMRKGNVEEAIRLGELTLSRSRRLEVREMMAKSLKLLGTICVRVGHFKEATSYFEQSLALYREVNHQQGVCTLLNNLGVLAFKRGDYRAAVTWYSEGLPLAQQIGSRDLEALLLDNLGEAHVGLGEYRAAESELRRALHMSESSGRAEFVSIAYSYLAEAYLGQNRPTEALEAAQEALLRGQMTGDPVHIGAAWRALGMVQAHPEGQEAALVDKGASDCFAESVRLLQETRAEAECARSLREWARYELERRDRSLGKRLWREALALFARLNMDQEVERMTILPARRDA